MLEKLREVAALGGPAAKLANDLLVTREQYESQELSLEEYKSVIKQIIEVRSTKELSNHDQAYSFIVSTAQALYIFV